MGMRGVLYAAMNGADIINTSWIGRVDADMDAQFIDQTLHLATDLGSLIVSSAGNSELNLDLFRFYPARHPRGTFGGCNGKRNY